MTQVFYLASSGHSGSTALGSLLGTSGHIEMVGEAGRLREVAEAKRCSCLAPIFQCPFWAPMWQKRREWEERKLFRKPEVNHQAFFEILAERSRKISVLDTSKNPRRLDVLARSGLRPKVLFLQRNGFAVVYSKVKKRGSVPNVDELYSWMNLWAEEQVAIRSVISHHELETLSVRLEDLHPKNSSSWAPMISFLQARDLDLDVDIDPSLQHQVDGNSLRKGPSFQFSPPDDSWRKGFQSWGSGPGFELPSLFREEMHLAGYNVDLNY